jgi:hypothetical protein
MRKKTLEAYRSTFLVQVQDTHIYYKEDGVKHLENSTNIGGVYYDVLKVDADTFKITSRIQNLDRGVQDYRFLYHNLKQKYGEVKEYTFWGRHRVRKTDKWIPFDVIEYDKDKIHLKARNEWERDMYRW